MTETTTTTRITIDSGDEESIRAAIGAGLATPESMARWLSEQDGGYTDAVCEDDILILEPDTWHADDGNAEIECEVDSAQEAAEEYVRDGEWGDEGGSVSVRVWRVGIDADGDRVDVDEEWITVDIPPDHDALIRAAGGDTDCDHEWTSEGEGGCDENPGVWSVGGTAMLFMSHCRLCGLHRCERTTGSQRNPGEHDTVTYEQPPSWCAECQAEECECAAAEEEVE